MALRERLGRLVLLEETETGVLGREYRAARLGPTGLDRLVTVLCFAPAVSSQAAVTKKLMDEARLAARLQNPGLVRVLGIGRVEQTFYVSTELVEGRTLASIFERCQQESFPFAADHALMVASRVASALEYLHGKKDDSGLKLFHGLLAPSRVVVSYDGEVKIKGLGLWPALRESDLLASERTYAAPEQAQGGAGDPRADVYALGLMLLHALTGHAPDGRDPRAVLTEAKVVSVSGESTPVPKLLADTLGRALAEDPQARYTNMSEMRKAIDTLLFSGDFTPTTFDLAFFMHTLFRDDMDRESRAIDEARKADYREFLEAASAQESARPPASGPVVTPPPFTTPAPVTVPASVLTPPPATEPVLPRPAAVETPMRPPTGETPVVAPVSSRPPTGETPVVPPARASSELPLIPPPSRDVPLPRVASTPPSVPAVARPTSVAEPVAPRPAHVAEPHAAEPPVHEPTARESRASGRDASVRLTLGAQPAAEGGRKGLWIGIVAVLLVGLAAGGYFMFGRGPKAPEPVPLSPEAVAAMAKVKELEARLADLDKQRLAAEQKAADDAAAKLKKDMEAKGKAIDAAAMAKAQEDARQRARAEQQVRQQEELRRLAEAKRAEEQRIAAEMRAAEAAATPSAPPPAPVTTEAPAPTMAAATPDMPPSPSTAPVQPGSVVAATDPKLIPPLMLSGNPPAYPPLAAQQRLGGTVELSALVDENGKVAEVSVVRSKPKGVFDQAAMQAVRSRRYRAGTKDGVNVRVWLPIKMEFKR